MQETQAAQGHSTHYVATQDLEFSGLLNRASQQGAKFSLLLSMLQQDVLARPRIEPTTQDSPFNANDMAVHYPQAHLQAHVQDWPLANTTTLILHQDGMRSAQLWLAMHPQPLSLHNDAYYIDDEIYANCDSHAQARYTHHSGGEDHGGATTANEISVDETGLFELLKKLDLEGQV